MKKLLFQFFFILTVLGFYSCQDPMEDFDATEDFEEVLLVDTVFQFTLSHADLTGSRDFAENFDWENTEYFTTIIANEKGDKVIDNISLPWKTQGNSLNIVTNPITKKEGWEFTAANFGTQDAPVSRPYFAAFNKDQRKFYLFVRNTPNQSGSFAIGNLKLISGSSVEKISLDSKQTKFNQFDSWFNFEFEVPIESSEEFFMGTDWIFRAYGVQLTTITLTK